MSLDSQQLGSLDKTATSFCLSSYTIPKGNSFMMSQTVTPKPIQQPTQFESQRARVEAKLQSGQEIDIYDALFLSRYYPGVVKQINAPPLTPHERYEESALRSGPDFRGSSWTSLGYPQYEGKYESPNIPSGTKVTGVKETSSGLELAVESTQKPSVEKPSVWELLSLGAGPAMEMIVAKNVHVSPLSMGVRQILASKPTLTGYLLGRSEQAKIQEQYLPSAIRTSKGVESAAGFTYVFESLVNPRTPFKLSGPFLGGMLVGIVVESYIIGKLTEPLTKPVSEWTNEKLSKLFRQKEMPSDYLSWDKDLSLRERLTPIRFYGQPTSQAVGIEKAWEWSTPSVKGTPGMLEKAYGMPFYRSQTLGMAMPTEEWASVRAVERFASQHAIESQWGWESKVMSFSGGGLVETLMPSREGFETSETLKMNMPTRRIEEQWYTVTRGTPHTPMEVTLNKAIERNLSTGGKGGISATQELVFLRETVSVPSPYTFPKEPVEGFAMDTKAVSYTGSPQLMFERGSFFGFLPIGMPSFRMTEQMKGAEDTIQIQRLVQLQKLSQRQELSQTLLQTQTLTQLQVLEEPTIQKQIQEITKSFSSKPVPSSFTKQSPFDVKFELFKERHRKKGGWEKRYLWKFPVKGAKEMRKAL